MTQDSLTPRSDRLMKEVETVLKQYNEGAIFSAEACLTILVALGNWEKEICDENDAILRHNGEITS